MRFWSLNTRFSVSRQVSGFHPYIGFLTALIASALLVTPLSSRSSCLRQPILWLSHRPLLLPGKGMALLPSPSPKNRACRRVGRQRVTFSALFQRPPSERCVTLSMSHRSPVDATHSESGIHASRTLPLFKQHQPAALPHVVGSPNLKVLRRLRHHRALAP